MILLICLAMAIPAAAQGIYTTTGTGTTVNGNVYPAKSDVYLSGGPQNCVGNGLPDGTYYFQVTDPSASVLLSSDALVDRTLQVTGGQGYMNVYSGSHLTSTGPCNAAGAIGIQLLPYSNTPNMGGEYKVTVFSASCSTEGGVRPTRCDPAVFFFCRYNPNVYIR